MLDRIGEATPPWGVPLSVTPYTQSSRYPAESMLRTSVRNMLSAGYLEDWVYGVTLSGTPQGGVASPILSNIYLHKLDEFVEQVLIPENTRGVRRTFNPAYTRLTGQIGRGRKRGDRTLVRAVTRARRLLPSGDPQDPDYRRLRYIRYADDHLLGFTGPRAEAEKIKQ